MITGIKNFLVHRRTLKVECVAISKAYMMPSQAPISRRKSELFVLLPQFVQFLFCMDPTNMQHVETAHPRILRGAWNWHTIECLHLPLLLDFSGFLPLITMIFFVVIYRPLSRGMRLAKMITDTTITARESARVPDTASLKI